MQLSQVMLGGLQAVLAVEIAAGHPFPGIAAAEAALETSTLAGGWFTSPLYLKSRNYLGLKEPSWYHGLTAPYPTREFLAVGKAMPADWLRKNARDPKPVKGGTSWLIDDDFCHFARLADCAKTHVDVLKHGYSFALDIVDPEQFARAVSAKWSTGPTRGDAVVQIWRSHLDVLGGETAGAPKKG